MDVTVVHAFAIQPADVHVVPVPGHEQFLVERFAGVSDATVPSDAPCFFVVDPRLVRGCCHGCEQPVPVDARARFDARTPDDAQTPDDARRAPDDARAADVFLAPPHAIWWQYSFAPRHDSRVGMQSFERSLLFHERLLARTPDHWLYADVVSDPGCARNLRA